MKKVGRPPRAMKAANNYIGIKLTDKEFKIVKELAKRYGGNINKLFRMLVLGEKE